MRTIFILIVLIFLAFFKAQAGPIFDSVTIEDFLKMQNLTPGSYLTIDGSNNLTAIGNQSANRVFAGPTTGAAPPTFRLLEDIDIPLLPTTKITSGYLQTFQGIRSDSLLGPIPGWSFDDDTGSTSVYNNKDVSVLSGWWTFTGFEAAAEVTADYPHGINGMNMDFHLDRNQTGFDVGNLNGLNIRTGYEGPGELNFLRSLNVQTDVGNGSGSTVANANGVNIGANIATGATLSNFINLSLNYDGTAGTMDGPLTHLNINSTGATSSSTVGINLNNQSNAQNINGARLSNSANATNSIEMISLFNDGDSDNQFNGVNIGNNGDIQKSAYGFTYYQNGNVIGDGTGTNMTGVDINFNSTSIESNTTGFNFYNSSPILGNHNINGLQIGNQATGYRMAGVSVYNNANMTEEFRGLTIGNDSDTRTTTGIDVNLQGNATDDATGVRINVNNQTSTNQRPYSFQANGGMFSVNSVFPIQSDLGVDVGNVLQVTTEVPPGGATSNTDVIQHLMQSNLLMRDEINSGPFGLGVNGVGMVHQLAIDTGVTLPYYRALLVGASVPAVGVGTGDLTTFAGIEVVGLASFGGSINNHTRIGVQDAGVVGANFCDGATDCWFFRVNDPNAQNYFSGNLVLGGSNPNGVTNARLIISDGHTVYRQTTPPTSAPDANAGTSATCTVTGTDTQGKIELVTGSASWASGPQCEVSFDKPYATAPNCMFSAMNANAAMAAMNAFIPPPTNTDFTIDFVNPDIAPKTYLWSYRCD